MASQKILFLGAGRMGGAILRGWASSVGGGSKVAVIDPTPNVETNLEGISATILAKADELPEGYSPNVIVVAVKPQIIDKALGTLTPYISEETVVLSVAAGITVKQIQTLTNSNQAVVRCMPNLAAEVGQSATVAVASKEVGKSQKELVNRILQAIGTVHGTTDEDMMHAVTAISGSGPAYVFAFAEAMSAAAKSLGLSDELGLALSIDTISGAAALLKQNGNPADLRVQVTSPGGTTQAALQVLQGGLDRLVLKAVSAAASRSRELSKTIA